METRFEHQMRLKSQKHIGRKLFWCIASLIGLLAFIGVSFWLRTCFLTAPTVSYDALTSNNNQTIILDSQNQPIWQSNRQKKLVIKSRRPPKRLVNALTSIEDRSFYHEGGVNYLRTVSALATDLVHHNRQQGGSTLTQQLAKDSFFVHSRQNKSIKQKVQEIYLSNKLAHKYSKSEIMKMYLNKVYLGFGVYGMKTAAKFYMNKHLNRLTDSQAALLAGMVQSPTQYDPYIYPKYAKERRNTVLLTMNENHKINHKTYLRLKRQPISKDVVPLSYHHNLDKQMNSKELEADPYLQQVTKQIGKKKLVVNGQSLTIKTPLNLRLQNKVRAIADSSDVGYPNHKMQTGITVLNNHTGQVVAQVGDRNQTKLGTLNRAAQSSRSTGSAIKPIFDYAPAFDNLGWGTTHTMNDTSYDYPGTDTEVHDWDNQHEGQIPLDKALVESRNIPAVRTLAAVGLKRANNLLALSGLPKQKYYANAIGLPATTAQLASAYSALANYGVRKDISYISAVKNNNNKYKNVNQVGHRTMSQQTAFMLDKILEQVPQRGEIGKDAYIHGLAQAGKTGTTGYNNANKGMPSDAISNAWYAGYTKKYTIVVWNGYDNPKHYMVQKDSNISENIYRKIMNYLISQKNGTPSDWKSPGKLYHYRRNGNNEYAFKDSHKIASPSEK